MAEDSHRWAVLVGIGAYDDVPPLKYAASDAQAMQKFLQDDWDFPEQNVALLASALREPTRANVFEQIGVLRGKDIKANDLVLFYFSGHGMMYKKKDYLMPSDYKDQSPVETSIAVESLIGELTALGSENVVMLIDACREELPAAKAAHGPGTNTKELIKETPGIAVLFSCKESERSWEYEEKERGAFTHCVIEATTAEAEVVNLQQLAEAVTTRLDGLTASNRSGMRQTPFLLGNPEALKMFPIFPRPVVVVPRLTPECLTWLFDLHRNGKIDDDMLSKLLPVLRLPPDRIIQLLNEERITLSQYGTMLAYHERKKDDDFEEGKLRLVEGLCSRQIKVEDFVSGWKYLSDRSIRSAPAQSGKKPFADEA